IDAPVEGDDGEDNRKYDLPDETPGPEKDAELEELRGRVSAELAKLPEAYREILVMRVVQEMSYEEIADALGCQMGTVKSRLARARDELKKRLGDLQ
ncbi:MAG: sigma-70 family RNA polymerase sigma factor, partial [Victivallales bacterium]|nr:sigma-70 family RNA polymerase sigma factor [Victivallales bacterium]